MFRFFSKDKDKQPEQPDVDAQESENLDDPVASITYYVKGGESHDVFLDIFISDYDEITLKKMAKILSGLSSLRLSVETLQMIKDSLIESGDSDAFFQLVNNMMKQTKEDTEVLQDITNKLKETNKEKEEEDQPWIKPSEIIR